VFFIRTSLAIILSAALVSPLAFASRVHRAPTSGHKANKAHKSHAKVSRRSHRSRGQQSIEPERVTQIQHALIREHYLSGDATGEWDKNTQAAMQKYQADQGWQTKLTPDSRALVKLGLGPDYSNAINAQNSSFAAPPPVDTIPSEQAAGFAAAAGVNE